MKSAVQRGLDPRAIIAKAPMHFHQVAAVLICVILNAMDGFDVLSISFASPGIAEEWQINKAALGLVLSIELIGMAAGSLLLGHIADRIGRQPTALACLIIMTFGMWVTTHVTNLNTLAASRLFTGLGIGGMLAVTSALVAEYANDKWRAACVTLMAAGYPLGAIIGGSIASKLLQTGDWRDVFWLGSIMSALCLPLVFILPEPVGALMQRRPANLLEKVNRSLKRLGHAPVAKLPADAPIQSKTSIGDLFSPVLRRTTALLTAAYFCHITTFYFILKWVPKIVVDMGFSQSAAGGVLVWTNVGGLLGALLFSLLSIKFSLRVLLMVTMVASAVMVAVFGQVHSGLGQLSLAAATGGFFANAGIVGLYALITASFPTAVRAGGTGFVIGLGRGGAALGPIIGGSLLAAGFALPVVAAFIALGSLGAALVLRWLPKISS